MKSKDMVYFNNWQKVVSNNIGYLFIILFVYAATSKLIDLEQFKIQLGQSPLLTTFSGWIALLVPIVELIIAFMLLIPRYRLFSLCACLGIMSVFTLYIIAILNFSDYVPCSCGGILEKMGWTEHLIFNSVFVILAIAGVFLESDTLKK